MNLVLTKRIHEMEWTVQGLTESDAGLLKESLEDPLPWEMGLLLSPDDCNICTDDSEETEDISHEGPPV